MPTPLERKATYLKLRLRGFNQSEAAREAGMSRSTGVRLENDLRDRGISIADAAAKPKETLIRVREAKRQDTIGHKVVNIQDGEVPEPKDIKDLCPEARRALTDFAYFQQRYFGRIATPWQVEAANQVIKLLETPEKEHVVVNCPPGAGKTTLFTHDIPAWLTCRNRAIRGLIGSANSRMAMMSLRRLQRTLERAVVEPANENEVALGLAVDPVSTLSLDYGRFKPLARDIWARDGFFVEQLPGRGSVTEKEPTWSSYGIDSGFLGGRFDFVIWDDLVDPRKFFTAEAKEKLQDDYQDLCETRVEPSGLLILQGQRLASDDLYRFALDMTKPLDDEDELLNDLDEDQVEALRVDKKYKHVIFKAHYEDRCKPENHKRTSAAYPEGCLLDPRRLSWRNISPLMENRGERFEVIYQQRDLDPGEILVQPQWITGADGNVGCIDSYRDRLQVPEDLIVPADCFSIATADPSPTNYWSIQWWLIDPASDKRYLIDLVRQKMDAPQFLDRVGTGFVGIMEDWQKASEAIGFPIVTWVIEQNAAQRFMLQYKHVKDWQAQNSVELIGHTTHRNKSDPQLGVQSLAPHYRFGRVRLPGRGEGRKVANFLINEVTRYPHGRTDDCVMAHWFLEWNLPNITPAPPMVNNVWRPTWVRGGHLRALA